MTLLFTDVEGSTRMLQQLGRERYVQALETHRRLLRDAFHTALEAAEASSREALDEQAVARAAAAGEAMTAGSLLEYLRSLE